MSISMSMLMSLDEVCACCLFFSFFIQVAEEEEEVDIVSADGVVVFAVLLQVRL